MSTPSAHSANLPLLTAAAFALSFGVLAWNVSHDGIAAPYLDPIAQVRSQDESLHVSAALRMAQQGDWLTPRVMGRLFLFKPPLLLWGSALSIRLFGQSLFAVRLPAVLSGAAAIVAIFFWCARASSISAGVLAAGMLLLSPFWQMFSRVCLTDVPAAALAALALAIVARDPKLEHLPTPFLFGVFAGLSILAKSVAGALPFAALVLYFLLAPLTSRPRFWRIFIAFLAGAIVAAPWHFYQAWTHPQWFWADYVQVQLFGVGLERSGNAVFARSPVFYLTRIAQMDPVFGAFALAGLIGALNIVKLRQRPQALLAACWAAVAALALLAFQAKHVPYLVFPLPPLAVVGALCGPAILRRPAIAASIVIVLFCGKSLATGRPWSLRPASPPVEGAIAMRQYYERHRQAELISADPDDEFYSMTIPLPHVRYCFLDPAGSVARMVPHYVPLGIVLDADQFASLATLWPHYETLLREWGVNSPEAIGSAIVLKNRAEITRLIHAAPSADFYLPSTYESALADTGRTHELVRCSENRILLLNREAGERKPPIPVIPPRW